MNGLNRTFLTLLASFALTVMFSSCVTTGGNTPPDQEKYSSMPHNLPQSWEGQSAMGGMMNQY